MTTRTIVTAGLVNAVNAAARRRRSAIGMTFLAPVSAAGAPAQPVRRTVSRTAEAR